MSATYSPSLLTNIDHIRYALGETDTTTTLIQDETITAKVAAFGYVEGLAQLAEGLISVISQEPDTYKQGDVNFQFSSRVSNLQKLVDKARNGLITPPGLVTAPVNRTMAAAPTNIQRQQPGNYSGIGVAGSIEIVGDNGELRGFRGW
jgi:hypothetical protein